MDWSIRPRAHTCAGSGRDFADGQVVYTVLVAVDNGMERRDFSEEVWEKVEARPTYFCFWKGKFRSRPPEPEKEPPAARAEAELRRRLAQPVQTESPEARVIFLFALLLERRKVLLVRERTTGPEGRVTVYEHKMTGEVILVPEPEVRLSEVDQLRSEVESLAAAWGA
ncbi:MAG: hypothetical protein NTZ01_01150 [Verrucomicrobia bacterium]|nr:hypothetical protein [Verrucomicrobiota bacterium]